MLKTGTMLDNRYEILKEIGNGGTGVVFLAYHHGLQKYMVVKKIKQGFTESPNIRVEVDILKNLHHPFLPQVYDFIQYGDQIYTVMDYIEGYDLEYYRKQGYRFGEKQLIVWLKQLLQVLDYLHSQSPPIIHSDIKPANIMINGNGNICLIDFNVSLGTEAALIWGMTRQYASPEQIGLYETLCGRGDGTKYEVDARTDIYSLGLTFYELMTGAAPPGDRTGIRSLLSLGTGYSTAFCAVIQKAMQENKDRRYRSAGYMQHALENMEKRPSTKLKVLDWAATALWIGGLTAAVWLYACGIGVDRKDAYQESCGQLQQYYTAYDSEQVKTLGEKILENDKWKNYLQKDTKQQADVLRAVGDAWFWEEAYIQAADYYRQALQLHPGGQTEQDCYRDAAIALARSGDINGARAVLSEAYSTQIPDLHVQMVQGEIALQEGEFETAIASFQQILNTGVETELKSRAFQGLAETYARQGDSKSQVQTLRQLAELQPNILNLRRLGAACSACAAGMADSRYAWEMNQEAKNCYAEILEMDLCTREDRINYAIICENCGDYAESLRILRQLAQEEPDNYEWSKRICYLLYQSELQKSKEERDFGMMLDYYRLAWRQYETRQVTGDIDEEMQALKQVADSLQGME